MSSSSELVHFPPLLANHPLESSFLNAAIMRRRFTIRPILTALLCGALITTGAASRAESLQSLFNGSFLTVGNCRFDNWQLLTGSHTTGAALDYSLMSMNVLANDLSNPGLQFASGGQLAIAGGNAIDLSFSFQVHAIGASNSFAAHSLNLTGVNFPGPGGIAYISQEVATLTGVDLGPTLALADNVSKLFEFNDSQTIAPHLNLRVTVNVFMTGLVAADAISLTAFTQRFAQTGPTSIAGDYNNDKTVDGADFLRWQRGLSPTPLSQQDLNVWKANYGQSILAAPALTALPEPTAAPMLLTATALLTRLRPRCSSRRKTPPLIR
jgi:hypothetical protein